MTKMSLLNTILLLLAVIFLPGCGEFDYYLQGVEGQMEVLRKGRKIPDVMADPQSSPELKEQLEQVLHIRQFASNELFLPDNNSYRSYADLGRSYVVWNVVATPEFSLEPLTWCFPIAGCVPYRGYFAEEDALRFAEGLKVDSHDILVYGVVAYSTLDWFDDPALNTFTGRSRTYLASLIFHELAHQKVYLPGDANFNEAFAKTVEIEGVRRWLADYGTAEEIEAYDRWLHLEESFIKLSHHYRNQLDELYSGSGTAAEKRSKKKQILQNFKSELRTFLQQTPDFKGFDRWLDSDLNNARFASLSTYHDLVPAFRKLLKLYSGDLQRFYEQASSIADSSPDERSSVMAYLGQPFRLSRRP